ncbi:SMP-30/gluconolactonase/LRE family protein [Shewanella sp. Scap07]|uniref:SMP-30/gluconolactonase/LRE family protein n=1 Tax=Shewanella sp. Scap07 TaxID=2589987 RepID=UPI0015BAAAF7|nr:SMP-30/gluconolactonase/LRE family protein [Shewanella sp. Scap07]QLE87138.1 SMP-30/gluconolactonase/LRE family protein [Shewanella sp. Scap07]
MGLTIKFKLVAGISVLASALSAPLSAHQTDISESLKSQDWVAAGTFTQGVEGPAVDKQGNLYAVNFGKEGTIGRVDSNGHASLYLSLPEGSIGNGIRFDAKQNMYIADYMGHNILKVAANSTEVSVYAHNADMNQPNDIAIMDNGILFASDPNWAESSGQLWRIDTQGQTQLLEQAMGTTNGIEVSPDNRTLYVNESVQRKVWQYDLSAEGEVSNKRLLIAFDDHGLDGMRTDNQGNLYIARYGAGVVAVVSPAGKLMYTIELTGQHPTNVAFGGEDGRDLYITMQKRGAIEKVRVANAGRNFN